MPRGCVSTAWPPALPPYPANLANLTFPPFQPVLPFLRLAPPKLVCHNVRSTKKGKRTD
jgi:hypothetical protein